MYLQLLTLAFFLSVVARSQAYEGNIQYDKKKQDAIVIDYAYPPEAVENAIIQKLQSLGYKAKEEKGFLNKDRGFVVFKNAYITDISDKRYDYIIKVDRKSRKESDEAVMYLIIQNNGENAISKLESYDVGRAKSFLNNMIPDIEAAHLELQIKDQEDVVAKAEKKLRDLEDEQKTLERKLEQNDKDQKATQADIESQTKSLENLKSKRKKKN